MSVLSHQSIKARCKGFRPMITNHLPERIRSASYDLAVGPEFYLSDPHGLADTAAGGKICIQTFDSTARAVDVGPSQVILFRTRENVNMPKNVCGHLSLKLDVMLQGLIMSNQSQIDAGYRGPIYGLLYNLSDQSITLHSNQPVLRLEFAFLDAKTSLPYKGDFKPGFGLGDVVNASFRSGLSSMNERIRRSEETVRRRTNQIVWGALFAGVAIVIGLLGPLQNKASDARSDANAAQKEVEVYTEGLREAQDRVAELEARLEVLADQIGAFQEISAPTTEGSP